MKDGYQQLGKYIRPVDKRNRDLAISKLLGVSITKQFIPSIANIIGTDLSNYKIVRTGQFAYGPVTSRNGEKISVALLKEDDCIISSSYSVFEVIDKNELNPEYLMLWFSRPEFDRYARYHSHGSVREIFDWDEMCQVELPVPGIDKQNKIVDAYRILTDRIDLKQRINDNLEASISVIFKKITTESSAEKAHIVVRDHCRIFTGKKDVNQASSSGKNKFYSCSPVPAYSDDFIYQGKAILVAGNGSFTGRTIYVDEAFDLYQRTYAMVPITNEDEEFLYMIYAAMQSDFQQTLQSKLHGSAIPYIVYGDLADYSFDVDVNWPFYAKRISTMLGSILKNKAEIESLKKLCGVVLSSISSS